MRRYFLKDPIHPKGGVWVGVKRERDCVFCRHCSNVLWDYTSLIYYIDCDLNMDPWAENCERFEGG